MRRLPMIVVHVERLMPKQFYEVHKIPRYFNATHKNMTRWFKETKTLKRDIVRFGKGRGIHYVHT